jgi:hypothetical protein
MKATHLLAAACLSLTTLADCNGPSDAPPTQLGLIQIALRTTGSLGTEFQLTNASVRFRGPVTKTEVADAEDAVLTIDVPSGTYSTQLLDGWELLRLGDGGTEPVEATLVSQNPVQVDVAEGAISDVVFLFDVSGELVPFGLGRIRVDFDVFEGDDDEPGGAEPVLVQNDGFVDGGSASFQGGFVVNSCAAAVLQPDASVLPAMLSELQLLFGGNAATQTVTVRVYGTGFPSASLLLERDYALTGASDSVQSIDLSVESIQLTSDFAVALCFNHSGFPGIAGDTDGTISSADNWISEDGEEWFQSSSFGIQGDWIIRAEITPQ